MLTEIAAEVLRFLTRRDLDKTCAISKWLDAMISQCCELHPLRPVHEVSLYPDGDGSALNVGIEKDDSGDSGIGRTTDIFSSMDEAVHFVASLLRHSYVEYLMLGMGMGRITLHPNHWAILIDAIRNGAVRGLFFNGIDIMLDAKTFLLAADCRGLQTLLLRGCLLPNSLNTDELIRSSVAKGLLLLASENNSDAPRTLSEDGVLDFFFRANAVPGGKPLILMLNGYGLTATFLTSFFKRLLSSTFLRSGKLKFHGAAKQRGLSAYAQYLAQEELHWAELIATYRFPLSGDDGNESYYEVKLRESTSHMRMKVSLMCGSP
ncbi:hypothetical protein AAVH_25029 [Aphelenchoides avenae]|nr:hypothetical protein AAVH_25029 [Aphelenchus avenae]